MKIIYDNIHAIYTLKTSYDNLKFVKWYIVL